MLEVLLLFGSDSAGLGASRPADVAIGNAPLLRFTRPACSLRVPNRRFVAGS